MCSRYEQNAPPAKVIHRFGVTVPHLPQGNDIRPTNPALVIGADGANVQTWGLQASWDRSVLINARAETLHERASFKTLLNTRILVPATLWWEWMQTPSGKSGRKMALRPADLDLFAFAGLTNGERFTIITCAAPPEMAPMNDRMPVILRAQDEATWIDPAVPYPQAAQALTPRPLALDISAASPEPPQLDLFQ